MPFDTYEHDFTFDDPASAEVAPYAYGGGPYRGGAIAAASTPPPPAQEDFLPQRDITPMGDPKFFQELDASGLNAAQRLRLQNEYFQGVDQVQAYRDNLRQKEQQSMINDLRIAKAQETLAGIRRRQTAAQQANESRDIIASQIQEIRRRDTDPAAQAEALAALETEYLPKVASDQTVSRMFDMARKGIPQPASAQFTPTQQAQFVADGVPPDIVASDNPFAIGFYKNLTELDRKERELVQSYQMQEAREVTRERRRLVGGLLKDDFTFLSQDERIQLGVDGFTEDGREFVNPNQYLRPESHDRARLLVRMVEGAGALAKFEELSDEEKRDYARALRFKTMEAEYLKFLESEPTEEEVTAAGAVPLSGGR